MRLFGLVFLLGSPFIASPIAPALTLKFLADSNTLTDPTQSVRYGGLSGLSYDEASGRLVAISDDKGDFGPPRFYTLSLEIRANHLALLPTNTTTLHRPDGSPFPMNSIDPEGIAILDANRLFVSSEGRMRSDHDRPNYQAAIYELGSDGTVLATLPVPDKFLSSPAGNPTRGCDDNAAFEGLSLNPDKTILFAAVEAPLLQDDTAADRTKTAVSRILQYDLSGGRRVASKEVAYIADAEEGNGISDILALSDHEILVLERGYTKDGNNGYNTVRLYKANLSGATNIASVDSLKNADYKPASKELVLDLKNVVSQLDSAWRTLDNLEGLTFGPTLPNGHRTLLLIADDNFSPTQRTLALAFEVQE